MRHRWHREECPDHFGTALETRIVRGKRNPFGATEELQDRQPGASPHRESEAVDRRAEREVSRLAMALGLATREERVRRRMTLGAVAELSGVGLTTVHDIESGRVGSLETYVRLADALRLRAAFALADPRRREPLTRRAADPVHAAMGEAQAAHLRTLGFQVGVDEPFQHYQFAGRADVVAWSSERRALLHIENRTRFPDLQDSFGSFNSKRSYLGPELAARFGVAGWQSETHVVAGLWSGEVLRVVRAHASSFASVCPGPSDSFDAWWRGAPPPAGRQRVLVVFDPEEGRRSDRRRWLGRDELSGARPRYRDYADAVALLGLDRR